MRQMKQKILSTAAAAAVPMENGGDGGGDGEWLKVGEH